MSNNVNGLIPPSEAYKESAGGFKIPELTLGSFFVGYGLAFFPLLSQLAPQSHGRLGAVLLSIQYVSISITFMFLTVTFYAKYRAEILTMPQLTPNRPAMDLTLMVTGLMAFAFSMVYPWLFPILLSSNLLLTAVRQNQEYAGLASLFYKNVCESEPKSAAYNRFYDGLKQYLRNHAFSELSGWGPTRRWFWVGSVAMFVVGLIVGIIFILSSTTWVYQQSMIAAECAAILVATTIRCFGVLRRRAAFILSQAKRVLSQMDDQFWLLKKSLRELCPGRATTS